MNRLTEEEASTYSISMKQKVITDFIDQKQEWYHTFSSDGTYVAISEKGELCCYPTEEVFRCYVGLPKESA